MSFKVVLEVWRHGLIDALRDRRMLTVALMGAFLPSLLQVMLDSMIRREVQSRQDASLEVVSAHRERAPNLFEWLEAHDVKFSDAPADAEAALRERRVEVMLEVDEHYGDDWQAGKAAKVTLAFDSTHIRAQEAAGRLEHLLGLYGQEVGTMRLVLRGIAPEVAHALFVGTRDVAPARAANIIGLIMLPFLLLMGALVGAGMLAVDLTAGERERHSIESLLTTAASRESVMLGKIFAASTYGAAILVAQALVLMGVSAALKSDAYRLELSAVFPLLGTLLPLVVLVATSLTGLAAFSKTVREAQSAMSLVVLLPMAPMLYLLVVQPKPTWMTYAIPALSQFQLSLDILRGDSVSWTFVLINFASMALVCGVVIGLCSRLYRRESLAISA